ncbi:MAG: copper chaperone PCu(A)C [Tardiphaga sp.]|uniref:copper chaperone PCu(A)C n=1 Tax=Tardiphaga sp. TaxID=1926292 RepID=UPI002620C541|nr:copper chaperone PCu(A)C [Tardiphaga sp.]MDB5503579.1 copper chaperone PCu(A)C [Tardiphaga sp.]
MTLTSRIACLVLLSTVLAAPVHAEDVKSGNLVISQPWSRATPGGAKVAGGYLTIENKGTTPDRLLTGSTDFSKRLEIHEMATTNGVMTMRPMDGGVAIEPGKTVKFAPGGYHLMFLELNRALKQGDSVPVTLTFEKAGDVKVSFSVAGVGAQSPDAAAKPGATDMKDMPGHHGMHK